jgi:hypothetical protein
VVEWVVLLMRRFKKKRYDVTKSSAQLCFDYWEEERVKWIKFIKFNQKEVALQFIREHPELGIKKENIKWENKFLDILERK